ncbi:MAG: prepilin-type N-terminal cleavage/methylation domain-containing protein [Lachnospiraceae bacterium]|nr:prepilin-type N-terminal cleavage/methylation domain-containing protein [Lachnospiraceae bacterium]
MKKKRLDNAGYSLLEVIIVAAIIALVTGLVIMSFGALNTRKLDECAKKLKMGLETNRVTNMGKLSASVSVYVDGQGYLVLEEDINGEINTKRVGDSGLTYKYSFNGVENSVPQVSNKITIRFDRNSGALKPQETNKFIDYFLIELDGIDMKVSIDKLTGKVSVD